MKNENIINVDFGDVKFQSYDLKEFLSANFKSRKMEPTEEVLRYAIECHKAFPPMKSRDLIPPWFGDDHPLRRCHGINKIVHSGFLIRAPFDIHLKNFLISPFDSKFLDGFPVEPEEIPMVFKLLTPLMIKSRKKYDVLFVQPSYHFRGGINYRIQSGFLSIDKLEGYEAEKKRNKEMRDWQRDPFGEQVNPLFTVDKHEDENTVVFKQGYPVLQIIVCKR
jgi:hypothetical protein